VMYMLPLATANAVGVLVGQAIGARKFAVARSIGLTGLALALAIAATSGTVLTLGAGRVAAFYTSDDDVQALAASLLVLVAGYHMFDALQAVTVNALRNLPVAQIVRTRNVFHAVSSRPTSTPDRSPIRTCTWWTRVACFAAAWAATAS